MQQQYSDTELLAITRNWGWSNPSSEILVIAQQARDAKRMKTVELLVHLGIVSAEVGQQILATKPQNIQTIAWFAQQDNINLPMERVLALMSGYAFYDSLTQLSIHPSMQTKDVIKHAEEIDAALMLIEESVPVLIFSTFAALIQYSSMGRGERMQDSILRNIEEPKLAVGVRDEISAVLKALRSEDQSGSLESANIWNAESAENKSKAENREMTRLIDHALRQGATDISLRPFRSGEVLIQLRKYGQMIAPKAVSGKFSPDLATRIISLLQAKSGSNPTSTIQRTPTDGQITYRSAVGDAFLRLSFIPLNHLSELRNLTSVSIRLLPRTDSSVQLTELKLNPKVIEHIHFAMRMSQGLVLIVGPTNSGKSSTVAGCIGEHIKIYGDSQKRISVEDPVERFLYGITQINVPNIAATKEHERFGIILRAIKRHDPDLISIGEVRDSETANLCVSSASTGHLVLSTLHANHTVMGFDVLAKSVDADKRFQFVESLSMIISQRLVKQVCPHCGIVAPTTSKERRLFAHYIETLGEEAELPNTLIHAKKGHTENGKHTPAGCDKCANDGYIELIPINEVLPFNRIVKDAAIDIINGENKRSVMAASRTITLLQSGLDLLKQHKVELDDLLV